MEWISVKDELPKLVSGKYARSVLVAVYDPAYAELKNDPQVGYSVYEAMFDSNKQFVELLSGGEWVEICDEVTHWMYLPKPPERRGHVEC